MDDIKRILDSLSQSRVDDYKTWLEVGMALHASGESCALWENWSRKSAKFREGECQKRWTTFGNYAGAPITIASVAKMAIDDGYKPSEGFGWDDPIGHSQTRKSPNAELKEYLSALFKSGDIVNFVVSSFEKDGKFLPCGKGVNKPFDELIKACDTYDDLGFILGDWNTKAGAWARINPMSGEGCKNSDVAEFRHCLIESDTLPKSEQLRKIRELNLPCSAIVDSGGKSVHAIVKIDAGKDEKLYRERVGELHAFLEKHGFPVDTACKNPSRLSRIAAVTRNGNRQRLIATNVGAKSFADWQKALNVPKYTIVPAGELRAIDPNDMSDNILGNRFLCRNGSWLIVAQSGIGKSVMAMQMALHFAVGKSVFGIPVQKPSKVLFIQAENNSIDLSRPFHSVIKKADFSPYENSLIDKNLNFISEESSSGDKFLDLFDDACGRLRPDIVFIDPLLSYIGGDISRQEVCSEFLRNKLNPLICKYSVGVVIIHHTGKPPKDVKATGKGSSLSYLGIGSSELTNWARAVSVIQENREDESVYEFVHTKRGLLSGTKTTTFLRHATDGVFWEECQAPAKTVKTQKGDSRRPSKYDFMKLETLAPTSKEELLDFIARELASHAMPCDSANVAKVVNLAKRAMIVFDESTNKWQGRLYIPANTNDTTLKGDIQ